MWQARAQGNNHFANTLASSVGACTVHTFGGKDIEVLFNLSDP
jgi:hypothetical protein